MYEIWTLSPKKMNRATKRQVAAMFAEEKPTLLPLPLEPFLAHVFAQQLPGLGIEQSTSGSGLSF
jgi:hypothetical protein